MHSDGQRDAWLAVLEKWAGEQPHKILDAGCGTGVISLLLAQLGHEVTGIDLSSEMLDRAREKAKRQSEPIDFYKGNVEDLSFADDTYDGVTARHLIWTLPNPEKALREWSRVVRPDGHLVLLEGHWDFDEPWDEYREIHEDLPLYQGPNSMN
nr:class I SAM-dependent methyltransferase [Halococcus sp. IIIV-5B]